NKSRFARSKSVNTGFVKLVPIVLYPLYFVVNVAITIFSYLIKQGYYSYALVGAFGGLFSPVCGFPCLFCNDATCVIAEPGGIFPVFKK
mgnify:CR=1